MAKEDREAFVSGLAGTSLWEIYAVIYSTILSVTIRNLGIMCSERIARYHAKSFTFAVLWEFITVIFPAFLCFTVLSDYVYIVAISILTIIIATLYISENMKSTLSTIYDFVNSPYPDKSPAISAFRTWVNIFTAIAILAVDFKIFPRRFAKTETYGYGLMDVGVGCYILCHGVVSSEAKLTVTSFDFNCYMSNILKCVKKIPPFVIIGLSRLLLVRATDYQQHVSEYGVHWNFFFTIVAVKVLCTLLSPLPGLLRPKCICYGIFGIIIALLYQLCLTRFGLMDYIISGPDGDFTRNDFISANREGLISSIGYVALYFMGVQMGRCFFHTERRSVGAMLMITVAMIPVFICFVGLTVFLDQFVDGTSRRAANAPYCSWIVSLIGIGLCILVILSDFVVMYLMTVHQQINKNNMAPSLYYGNSSHLGVVSAIDYNQFTYFMLANIFTGLVNFSIDTINTGPLASFLVLSVYLVSLTIVIMLMQSYKIKLV